MVWPILSQVSSSVEASSLGLFRIENPDAYDDLCLNKLSNTNHQALASLPDYKRWVLCACLVCPGEPEHLSATIHPDAGYLVMLNWQNKVSTASFHLVLIGVFSRNFGALRCPNGLEQHPVLMHKNAYLQ